MKIGIDLGGSHLALGVIDDGNQLVERMEKDFIPEDKLHIIEVIEDYIVDKVNFCKEKYSIDSIGIAIPGVARNGIILRTVNLGINNYDIARSLKEKLGLPIIVRNDAKCACLAEFKNMVKENTATPDSNMLFLTIGTGIGGGVIYNGKLFEGHKFDGCEFGHIVIKENGMPCKCGKAGCFERYGSILEYKNMVKNRLNIPQDINSKPLREIMDLRRDEFLDLEEQYISDLALGISNLINIFEPDIVVMGGGFAHFSYMFEDKIKERLLNSNLLFNKREDLDLRIAKLGNDAGIIGAIL